MAERARAQVPAVRSPEEAWDNILMPLLMEARQRGRERYGDQWQEDVEPNETPEYRAWHGLQVHAMARLAQVPDLVGRGQYQSAYALLASTAYHFAVIVAQIEHLRAQAK